MHNIGMVGRRTAILVVAISLAAGCGRKAVLLPPSPPGPPPQLKGAAGLALAEELLSVLGAKDDDLARFKSRVEASMTNALRQGDVAGENDMGLLFTIIGRAQGGGSRRCRATTAGTDRPIEGGDREMS